MQVELKGNGDGEQKIHKVTTRYKIVRNLHHHNHRQGKLK